MNIDPVEQALRRAADLSRQGQIDTARVLYNCVLRIFPNNERARNALVLLNTTSSTQSMKKEPPQGTIELLTAAYQERKFQELVERAKDVVVQYPYCLIAWNILAAGHHALGQLTEAEAGFQKAIDLNPASAEAHNNLGNIQRAQGELDKAIASYRRACDINPLYADAQYNMGVALQEKGASNEAINTYRRALEIKPDLAEAYNNMGNALRDLGHLNQAIVAYRNAVRIKPDYSAAYSNMGLTLIDQGKFVDAIEAYQRLLNIKPDSAEAQNYIGTALKGLGKPNEAAAAYRRAIEIKPSYAVAHNNLAIILQDQGKHDKALDSIQIALEIAPNSAELHKNKAIVLKNQGLLDEAIASFERALEIMPNSAAVYSNIGLMRKKQGKFDEAIAAYERALEISPDYVEALNDMATVLQAQRKHDEAIVALQHAIAILPTIAELHNNIGISFKNQGKLKEAIAAFKRALEIKPTYPEAYSNMAVAQQEQGEHHDAILAYERALSLRPDYAAAEAQMLHQRKHVCDFTIDFVLQEASERLGISTDAVQPFSALSWEDNPQNQHKRSLRFATDQYTQSRHTFPLPQKERPKRLKVGYFGADFHDHATMHLLSGVLREHDRAAFEIIAYSYGPNHSDVVRKRCEQQVEHFFEVSGYSDHRIIELVRTHDLDIAIDLKGYTQHTRSHIFQYRLAPLQLNYLGYPGTMGADFIDYIVADPNVIPEEQREFYSEKIIYLPHSYQPNDNLREIAQDGAPRSNFGLPDNAFVFCCFNNNYKISSKEFDIWMRLLHKVEGSVLWLLKSNKWAEQNLRKEAEERGVNSNRLVFAEKIPHTKHLARQRHADLFLDTFNYNAHTTASDALWGGLPLVTKQGKQFAARVASSLLTTVGLPELITFTEEEYENLIFRLATHPEDLAFIRNKLAKNRLSTPLFDTIKYTRNFEQGLVNAYELYWKGVESKDIWVGEDN